MIEIIKDHWSIEDQIRPSLGRKVQLIVDLYTDQSILTLPFISGVEAAVLELKIYGVNLGRELTYVKGENQLSIDLGDLRNWTSSTNSQGLTRVRLKIFLKIIDPHFNISKLDLGYNTDLNILGYKMDKGSLIVPMGLKIENNGEIDVESFVKCGDKTYKFQEKYIADHIEIYQKKKKYIYSVKKEMRDLLDSEDCEIAFKFSYKTVNDRKFLTIPLVSVAFLFLALFRSYGLLTASTKFDIRYLAASLAFLGLVLNFMRDGYELPFRKLILLSVLILILELSLELIFLPYG